MRIDKKVGLAVVFGLAAGLALAGVATTVSAALSGGAGLVSAGAVPPAPAAIPAAGLAAGLSGAAKTDKLGATPRVDWQSMLDFMAKYRSSDGTIDMNRMMGDVQSGEVTAPCGGSNAAGGTGNDDTGAAPSTTRESGFGFGQMMGGYGGGMMGGYPSF